MSILTRSFFVLILLSKLFACQAQQSEAALLKLYPKAKKITWRVDRNGSYEAHFKMNGSHYRSDFTVEGSWIETERSIDWDDLPPAVKHSIKKKAEKNK